MKSHSLHRGPVLSLWIEEGRVDDLRAGGVAVLDAVDFGLGIALDDLEQARLALFFRAGVLLSKRILNLGSITERYDRVVRGSWKVFAFNTNAYNEFIRHFGK